MARQEWFVSESRQFKWVTESSLTSRKQPSCSRSYFTFSSRRFSAKALSSRPGVRSCALILRKRLGKQFKLQTNIKRLEDLVFWLWLTSQRRQVTMSPAAAATRATSSTFYPTSKTTHQTAIRCGTQSIFKMWCNKTTPRIPPGMSLQRIKR